MQGVGKAVPGLATLPTQKPSICFPPGGSVALPWQPVGRALCAADTGVWGGAVQSHSRSPVQEDPKGGRNKQGLPVPILETYSLKGLESGRGKLEAVEANKRYLLD